ncbi:hypothetical protein [Paenibacillus sp. SI8]|uniref:hypothetical protein n=1 Tax=unclassified Paenibacillus TaxID=185978 RepID=UPI0034670B91
MDIKKIAGICVIIPMLLSGCGNGQSAQSAAAPVSSDQPAKQGQDQSTDQKQSAQGRPAMTAQQRQLFSTFQTLLMMDKADGLSITKDEAQAMLPTAQDIISKGEITDESKAKLFEKLTDAQKKFVDDAATRMSNRGNGNGNGGNAMKKADPTSQPDASKDTAQETPNDISKDQSQSKAQGSSAAKGPDGKGSGKGNRPTGEMKDPGKQLVELLQSKVN